MTVEEIKEKQQRAHGRLKPLENGADYEQMADAYEYAFDLVDSALNAALKLLENAQTSSST